MWAADWTNAQINCCWSTSTSRQSWRQKKNEIKMAQVKQTNEHKIIFRHNFASGRSINVAKKKRSQLMSFSVYTPHSRQHGIKNWQFCVILCRLEVSGSRQMPNSCPNSRSSLPQKSPTCVTRDWSQECLVCAQHRHSLCAKVDLPQ